MEFIRRPVDIISSHLQQSHDDELQYGDLAEHHAEGHEDGGGRVLAVEEAGHGDLDDRLPLPSLVPGVEKPSH